MIKDVCENNEYVSRYLGFGHRSLQIRENKKVRNIHDMLVKNPNIKRIHEKPVVFEWFESKPLCAPSDLCDPQKTKSENENDNFASNDVDISRNTNQKTRSHESHRAHRYDCYYCVEGFDFQSNYEKHVINKHPRKLC